MAIEKVLGIETEYGIAGGPDYDPIAASSIIVNAYAQQGRTRINWDFDGETPDMDARGGVDLTSFAPIVETHLANTVLTNGARLYVDHAHPEYSSPECRSPLEATLYDVAGEEIMRRALGIANDSLDPTQAITLYKNNSDGKGNSYGTHENYLVRRDVEFAHLVRAMVPHFVSRQVIVGSGKVGAETEAALEHNPAFQLSQRAEFFEEIVGLETTLKRPIINTRDEPHSDAERFRRLHVIIGDANMSQTATFVKLGSTALLLAALEEFGPASFPALPRSPVHAVRAFSRDLTLLEAVPCDDDVSRTAWDFQDELWHVAKDYVGRTGGDAVGEGGEVELIMTQWREMLEGVRDDRDAVADRVDWVAKLRVVNGYQERYALRDHDAKLRAIDLQYHDLRPSHSLAQRVGLRRLSSDVEVREAVHNPPLTTRAYFRGQCVARYPEQIVAANWDSVVFDLGEGPLQRVPMLDPLRGTHALTSELLETSATANELLDALDR
ncbi:MAG TPA: depupylase/deamidase Dop [Acidimicrobiales bacterium]|jgi:proteasome accessory factor A|nr:depupylase/deamidase Dop [Acidimicrobiales bacterium]